MKSKSVFGASSSRRCAPGVFKSCNSLPNAASRELPVLENVTLDLAERVLRLDSAHVHFPFTFHRKSVASDAVGKYVTWVGSRGEIRYGSGRFWQIGAAKGAGPPTLELRDVVDKNVTSDLARVAIR